MAPKAAANDVDTGASKPLSRHERRHGTKARAAPEPTIQIPKGAIAAAVVVLVVASILGVKTSMQAASSSEPFSMEGFEKKGKNASGGGGGTHFEPHERDTAEEDAPNGGWLTDAGMSKSMGISRCDIERVHHLNMTTKRFSREFDGVKPVIIEGLLEEKWPAKARGRWARPSLLSAFPDAAVHVSSGAGVVHSGGESLHTITLTEFLEDLRAAEEEGGASSKSFTFDLEFIDQNPELKSDFKIPTMFRGFNSHQSMRAGTSWAMLSLGASGAGLPFHSHGETWLGVAYGAKRWALYPPTVSRPYAAENQSGWHPLMGSLEWFQLVVPLIRKTGEAPPMECMQNPGDIIYVPTNWKHMTLNIGESIGVGGQAVYSGELRLRDGLELLQERPDDPEVLHAVGVGLAHRGIAALEYEGDAPDIDVDHAMAMNMIKVGQRLPPRQTIALAAENLKKAKQNRPGYPETHIILAEALFHAGSEEEAVTVIEEAWKIFSRDELPDGVPDSTLVAVQLNLARFFLQTRDGGKAEEYLRKGALSVMPDHGDAMADLGVAMAMQVEDDPEKLNEAIAMIELAEEKGASGSSFDKRSEYVKRIFLKEHRKASEAAAREEAEAAAAAAVPEGGGEEKEDENDEEGEPAES